MELTFGSSNMLLVLKMPAFSPKNYPSPFTTTTFALDDTFYFFGLRAWEMYNGRKYT